VGVEEIGRGIGSLTLAVRLTKKAKLAQNSSSPTQKLLYTTLMSSAATHY